ncbi:MAG: hypothetical protein JXR48_13250 [Candidatus Delongbacteria bacterium]|nr:hypothetical protein [Candidatus Delongbacteria bacterium]MBN2835921.1 hypothetical protein [Candidatus Delongbacteria bacterium]
MLTKFKNISTILYESIRKDLRTKFLFLVISILLWLTITLDKEYETEFTVPIKYEGIDPLKTAKYALQNDAVVKLRGKGRSLLSTDSNVYFRVDMSEKGDSTKIYLSPDLLMNYSADKMEYMGSVNPEYVSVVLDSFKIKRVPVVPQVKIKTKAGYTISSEPEYYPKEILLKGPSYFINEMDEIFTIPMELNDLNTSVEKNLPLIFPETGAVKSQTSFIKYRAEAVRLGYLQFKTLIKIKNRSQRKLIAIDPISVQITLNGPVNKLYHFSEEDFDVYVDLNEKDVNTGKVPLVVTSLIDLKWETNITEVKVTEF